MKNIISKIKIEWYYFKYVIKFKQKYKNKLDLVRRRFPKPRTDEEIIAFDRFCKEFYPLETSIPNNIPDWVMESVVDDNLNKTSEDKQNKKYLHYLTKGQKKILKRILKDEEYVYATDNCFNDIEQLLRLQNRPDDAEKVMQMSEKIYELNEEKAGRIKKLI